MMKKIPGSVRILIAPEDGTLHSKMFHYWKHGLELTTHVDVGLKLDFIWVRNHRAGYDVTGSVAAKGMAFKCLGNDYMPLADPDNWIVPFPIYLRLTTLARDYAAIENMVNFSRLRNSTTQYKDALKWTFWLHRQGIRHLEYAI